MVSVALVIIQALAFALMGVAVRAQFSLFRGFDLMIGGYVLIASETFVLVSNHVPLPGGMGIFFATVSSVCATLLVALAWNVAIDRLWPNQGKLGTAVLLASLGGQTFVAGLIGAARGPGLVQSRLLIGPSDLPILSLPLVFGLVVLSIASIVVFVFLRSRVGHGLWLYGDNPEFAAEIGVERRRLIYSTSIIVGLLTASVGSYVAFSEGSRPEVGLNMFLYGAASALLLSAGTLRSAFVGGLILGAGHLALQLKLSFAAAEFILFVSVAVLLVVRGTSRSKEGVR
jgi:branched-subunit amino acid ABC-type transport system permease component